MADWSPLAYFRELHLLPRVIFAIGGVLFLSSPFLRGLALTLSASALCSRVGRPEFPSQPRTSYLTVYRILRHSDVSVTQRCYIKTLPDQSIVAMKKLEMLIDQAGAVCNRPAMQPNGTKAKW
jgi:hypothetical protein